MLIFFKVSCQFAWNLLRGRCWLGVTQWIDAPQRPFCDISIYFFELEVVTESWTMLWGTFFFRWFFFPSMQYNNVFSVPQGSGEFSVISALFSEWGGGGGAGKGRGRGGWWRGWCTNKPFFLLLLLLLLSLSLSFCLSVACSSSYSSPMPMSVTWCWY